MARARLLVVASPTLDLIDGSEPRPGGPGLYAAAAAALLGCETEVLGPLGLDDAHLVAPAYEALGARLLGPWGPGCAARFSHRYTGLGRESRVECRPASLSPSSLDLAGPGYDAVLVSPVYCEVPPGLEALAASLGSHAAVDLQGYARCGLGAPRLEGFSLVHLSVDDPLDPPEPPPAGVVAYTAGAEGGVLYHRGGREPLPSPRGLVEDPTGAGDAFTALTLCMEALWGLDPVDAALQAADLVADALTLAGEALRGLSEY
ncbi:MAG: hypothetical protein GSR80_000398 [Desulfurococcales archaeon]|nr:hypothetical protein [Desulfurococcales archaeon]